MSSSNAALDGRSSGRDDATTRDSMTVAGWTLISRITGFAKVAVIAAVLGPTFFGNAYQFINSLPNFLYYGFLAGSLFASLLVPALVHHIDSGDRAASERIAGGFLGVSLVALLAAVPVAIVLGPPLLRLSAGTSATGAHQAQIAGLLVILVLPQLFLYGVVGAATAAMNARQRFALAAAAPAVENLATVAVLAWCAWAFGVSTSLTGVPRGELWLLGVGSSCAVGLHAVVQWRGARRAGVTLIPRAGWRDREVRAVMRRALPSLGQAGLVAVQMITMLVLANRVAGGVIGFQIGVNFYSLAIALGATPVVLSLLPRLARMHRVGDVAGFRVLLAHGYALGLFLAVPIAVAYLALAVPIARAVSFGRMSTPGGVALVAAALAGLALAVVGQTLFLIGSYACYARQDTRTPLAAMALQATICLAVAAVSLAVDGVAVMVVLGCAFSASVLLSGIWLAHRLRSLLGRSEAQPRLSAGLAKVTLGALAMAGPAWLVAQPGRYWFGGERISLLAAVVLGAALFGAVQAALRSEELHWLAAGLRQRRGRAYPPTFGDRRA